jgi:hypothetical protein
MYLFVTLLFALAGAWLVWVPWREYRHAEATGAPRLPFSRMLLRWVVAGCVLGIGGMVYLANRPAPDRSKLAELLYLLFAMGLALLMFIAGFVDHLFNKRDYLLGQREILRNIVRSEPRESLPPSENGHDPSPS